MAKATAHKESAAPRPRHERHRPEQTLLYRIIDRHYPEFLACMAEQGRPLPLHIKKEFDEFLKCGRLEHGFHRDLMLEWGFNSSIVRRISNSLKREC